MPMHEARRKAPHAAVLGGRYDVYRQSSRIVMALLGELSPLVEPLSIDEAFVKELAKHQPLRVVFRDAGYKNSAVKINVEQIFKLLSPATEVKCI